MRERTAKVNRRQFGAIFVDEDDFSLKASIADDPLFWIRMEKPYTDIATISDINFGGVDVDRAAEALVALVEKIPHFDQMIVKDILPNVKVAISMEIQLATEISKVVNLIERALEQYSLNFDYKIRDRMGKYDIIIEID